MKADQLRGGKIISWCIVFLMNVCALQNMLAQPVIIGNAEYECRLRTVGNFFHLIRCSTTATSITIPYSIEGVEVLKDFGVLNDYPNIKVVTLEGGFTTIFVKTRSSSTVPAQSAFKGVKYVTNIILPDSMTNIGEGAFSDCSSLTDMIIPDGVTNIGNGAFFGCRSLSSVSIPSSVTSIGSDAFYGCIGLTSVTIPEGVTSIENSVFFCCSGLTSVMVPSSVTSIGSDAFYGCIGLTSVTIPSGVTRIGYEAFYGCSGLTSVAIPAGVTSIENSVFRGCSGLTSVTIPEGVTSIGADAFYCCYRLPQVTIPAGVTSIGYEAFAGCNSLSSVSIPSSVTSIGGRAFYYSGLTSITIPESVREIGDRAFSGCCTEGIVFEGVPPNGSGDVIDSTGWYYSNMVGCYPVRYKAEWKSVIKDGYWRGLKMEMAGDHFYKVNYDPNGGTGCIAGKECEFGSEGIQVDDGGNLHWEGHCFVGWAFAPDGDVVYKAGDYVAEPTEGETVSLYAKWATLEPLSADWTSGAITLKATNVYGQQADRCWLAVCDANTTAAGDENGAWKPIDSVEFRGTWCDEYANCVVTDDKFATRLGGVPALKYRLQIGKSANEIRITVYSSVVRTKRGIFVGVGEYGVGYGSNKPSPRPFASGKTRQFHDLMVSDGKMNETDACLLTDSDATYEKVCEAFTNVGGKTKPGDVCVVYFSTHGGEISIGGKLSTVGSLYLYNYPPREADEHHVGYHEALLAKHLRMLDSEKKGVAVVCVISACHSGTFFYDSPEEDKLCNPFDSWCHKEDMSGLSIAWITSADAEHSSYASDSVDDMTRFLIDYGWVKGWGAKGESLTFYGLAHYAKGLYDALFDGLTFEGETGSLKMQIEDKSQMLSNIILCNAKSHDGTVLPPAKVVEARASTGEYPEEISTAWHVVDGARYYCVFAKSVNDAAACIIIHEAPSAKASFSVEKNPQMKNEILASSEIRPMRFVVKAVNEAGVSSSEEFPGWVKHADEDIELAYVYDHNLTYQFKGSAQSETLQLSVGKRGSVSAQGTMPNGERFAATTQAIVVNEDEIYIPILVNSKTGGTISLGVCILSSGAISIDEDAYWTNGDSRKSISLASDGRMVSFAANGGMGTMRPVQMASGRVFKLPKCTLKPPVDKTRFAGWACSNGKRYDDEMLVFGLGDVTMTAIWE